jgi:tetratricopeptide (TPR) repeat protein
VERQRTLRATLDWSYRLLDPSLQRFFAGLSVFRGGWTVEAAEQVLEEPLALDYLAQLRDCSLVQVGEMELVQPLGPTTTIVRFHLLETLREYAWEQLTEEEQHGLQERHIAFLVASIAKRSLISRWEAIGWFEAELSNCRAALVWGLSEQGNLDMAMHLCAGHGSVFWSHLGYWTEGRRWFIALLNRFSEPTATRAALLQAAGSLTDQQGDNTAALAMYQESLELGRALGNTEHTLNLLETNGFLACHMGRNEEGRAYFEEALQLSRSQGEDKDRVVGILNALGQLARNTGDFATAQAYCEQSLKLAEEMGDQTKVCYVFCELGLLAADKKDHITALTWYDKCIALCRKEVQQDILTLAHILTHRIDPLLASGDYAAAQQSGEEALAIFRHARDKWHTSYCLAHLATAASARGDFPAACTYLEECLEIRRELGNPGWILGTLLSLGRVALTAGDIPHARSVLAECLTMARDSGEDKTQWRYRTILHWLGLYDIVRGDYSSARAWYAECLPLARASTDSWALIPILEGLGILAEVENRQETAVQLWGTATTMRERLNSQPEALEEQILARYITRVRNTLGSDVFDSLFEQGRMLDQAAAIALGRGEYD